MANYATLKAAIQNVVKTNGNNEITGALLQQTLLTMVNSLGAGYQYMGVATPTTNPGMPDPNVFYLASTAGTYANFGDLVLADGEIAILKYNGVWSKDSTGTASLEKVNQLGQDLDAFHADVFGGEFEKILTWTNGYISKIGGTIKASSASDKFTQPFTLKKGEKVTIGTANSNICIIGTTNAQSLAVGDSVTVLQITDNTGNFETHTYTATEDIQIVLCVKWSDYSLKFENVASLKNRVDGLDDSIERISRKIAEPVRGTDTDFMELDDEYNLFIPTDAVVGKYINGNTGNEATSGSLVASDYIPVSPETLYHISGGQVLARYYAFYSADKSYLSGDNVTQGFITQLTTPALAKYVRFTGLLGDYQDIIFSKNPLSPSEYKYTPKSNVVITPADGTVTTPKIADGAVTDKKTVFFEHDDNSNFIDRSKLTPGYYIDANGVPRSTTSSNYFITDKVFLAEGETYYKGNLFVGYCAFYREDGTLVQGYGGTAPFLPNPFVVPQGAVYGRFTLNVAGADQTCWISKSNIAPVDYRLVIKKNLIPESEITPGNYSGRDICTFAKIMCIGDSLTEGAFNYLSGDSFSNNTTAALLGRPYSYPQYLKKLTGCDVTNLGKSGFTSKQWYDYYTTGAGASVDFSGYDCAIIQLGVNDVLATLDTVTKDALDNIISKVKTANAGIKIFLAGIINAKSYPAAAEGESYYAKDQWLRNYYNTYYENDNQVFFVDHVSYGHLRTLGNAQYGGSYPVDNYNEGHLSAYGYWRLAQDYINIIGYIMSHNTTQDFRKIQFIGTNYQCY